VPGTFPIHDLTDIGVDLPGRPDGGYTTVAGLLLASLGHIPSRAGESISIDGWALTVAAVDHHAISAVRMRRSSAARAEPAEPVTGEPAERR
jgi:putative hemolysin